MSMLKRALKGVAVAVLPERATSAIQAYRSRNFQMEYVRNLGIPEDNEAFVRSYGNTILAGPLQGMHYPALQLGVRPAVPYLIGCVEKELHPFLQTAFARSYDCALNIGCAEGYYAVGIAWLKKIPVYAFDPEYRERAFCRRLARANGVSNLVDVRPWFSVREMQQFASQRCLVISDCEGYETTLFDAQGVDYARNWDLIIELHGAEAEAKVPELLSKSHATTLIASEPRRIQDYPMLDGIVKHPGAAISENRPIPSYWLWAESQANRSARS
jgi:precorrin-6B methylase 2